MESAARPSQVYIQITDPHLLDDQAGQLDGVESLAGLRTVLEHVEEHFPNPDAFLVTGDLVHEGSALGYRHLVAAFAGFACDVHVMPGNHDNLAAMRAVLPRDNVRESEVVDANDWVISFLDSRVQGREDGSVTVDELARLEERLEKSPGRHALIAMHHNLPAHPRRGVASSVDNADEVMEHLARWPQIRAVISGHVHQEMTVLRGGILYLSAPTPAFQSLSVSGQPTGEAPGYRRIELFEDGTLLTDTVRITSLP